MNVQLTVTDCDEAITNISDELKKCKADSRTFERLYKLRDSYLTQRYLIAMEEKNVGNCVPADE